MKYESGEPFLENDFIVTKDQERKTPRTYFVRGVVGKKLVRALRAESTATRRRSTCCRPT